MAQNEDQIQAIKDLRDKGYSWEEIRDETGYTSTFVKDALAELRRRDLKASLQFLQKHSPK